MFFQLKPGSGYFFPVSLEVEGIFRNDWTSEDISWVWLLLVICYQNARNLDGYRHKRASSSLRTY